MLSSGENLETVKYTYKGFIGKAALELAGITQRYHRGKAATIAGGTWLIDLAREMPKSSYLLIMTMHHFTNAGALKKSPR